MGGFGHAFVIRFMVSRLQAIRRYIHTSQTPFATALCGNCTHNLESYLSQSQRKELILLFR